MTPRRIIQIGTFGLLGSALCCFTPVLVIALPALGLAGLVSYLDRVLWPLMAVSLALVALGWWRRARAPAAARDGESP